AVFAYARRRATKDEADDVVSETFLVAWRRFDELPAEPLPWLIGTARKVLANRRRSDDRRDALVVRLRSLPGSSPSADPGEAWTTTAEPARKRRRGRNRLVAVDAAGVLVGGTAAAATTILGRPAPDPVRAHLAELDEGMPPDLRYNPDLSNARAVAETTSGT